MAFLDTMNTTCPFPRLLHGKTNSLAPPAALTPLTSPNTPLKYHNYTPKAANSVQATFSSLLGFPLSLLYGQITETPAGGKRVAADHFSRGSSTQLLLIDSNKGSKAPFSPFYSTSFPKTYTYKTSLQFPSSLKCQKMGKSKQNLFKGKQKAE